MSNKSLDSQSLEEPVFDYTTFQEIPCGITLNNISNSSLEDLTKLETLTSRSDKLNEESLIHASKVLASFEIKNVNIELILNYSNQRLSYSINV